MNQVLIIAPDVDLPVAQQISSAIASRTDRRSRVASGLAQGEHGDLVVLVNPSRPYEGLGNPCLVMTRAGFVERRATRVVTDSRFLAQAVAPASNANDSIIVMPIVSRFPSLSRPSQMSTGDRTARVDSRGAPSGRIAIVEGERAPELLQELENLGLLVSLLASADELDPALHHLAVDSRPDTADVSFVGAAMAYEIPTVISHDSGGPRDLIRHQSSGLVAAPGLLVRVVADLAADSDEQARLGWDGAMFEREASWGSVARAVLATPPMAGRERAALPRLDSAGQLARSVRFKRRLGHIGTVGELIVVMGESMAEGAAGEGACGEADGGAPPGGSGSRPATLVVAIGEHQSAPTDWVHYPSSGIRTMSLLRSADRIVLGDQLSGIE
ncbi:MAG: hypothetical protein ACKVHU_08290 [Acidimicrobiales bacterium]|jgi:hypothetical protein